ncbi:SusD/RagB family nutrient-binding outer membrane lipoprotein [Chitinophaga tropicalis]|uniref:SusD/RagB family nutrient-binding outer membrane lipoprotein n=1 Tax=Chitinophaga tropicalis TaxID=2683588 RepID=A0A7K1U7G1_9BACT|nr:SusD/RagB family nutrient-binding outer membrane lipoprotein [Chitinophaga tropicalis]MVT09935.1 SusD/RagB family nutrient-binding outer membrane lipoprotein [Chitinophaga tropicalis]
MKMRFNYLIYTAVAAIMALQSCDKGFEELNTNPDASPVAEPEYVFSKALLDAMGNSYFATNALACGGSMQHFATYKDVPGIGDKYYFQQGTYPYDYFTTGYVTAVNEIATTINALDSTDAADANKLAIAKIFRVYIMHRITDLYGDIPYTDAVKGYTTNNFTPKYDSQASIYADMLNDLEVFAAKLNAGRVTFGAGDFIYSGDVTKWKKFAYSLMLRLGMRLSKRDAATAEVWVKKAIAGGVITADADIATMKYSDGSQTINRNPAAAALLSSDYAVANGNSNTEGGKLAQTFITSLKNNNDPRLNVIAVVWNGGKPDTSTALQKGMPNGLLTKPADFVTYSEPNPATILQYDAPYILMSAAETNLLLAEASVRGWYEGNAADAFSAAIGASMRNWALFGDAGVIASTRIAQYQAAHQLTGTTDEKLAMIGAEKWVSLFIDEQEIYADWRRTGYPQLTPVNIPGNITGGTIPRRLLYPPSEESVNSASLAEAITRQGANLMTTHIWWDKQ